MTSVTDINCDHCGTKLNVDDSYPHNYGIRVFTVDYGVNTSGMTYAVGMSKPIETAKDFCGLTCLHGWLEDQ